MPGPSIRGMNRSMALHEELVEEQMKASMEATRKRRKEREEILLLCAELQGLMGERAWKIFLRSAPDDDEAFNAAVRARLAKIKSHKPTVARDGER